MDSLAAMVDPNDSTMKERKTNDSSPFSFQSTLTNSSSMSAGCLVNRNFYLQI